MISEQKKARKKQLTLIPRTKGKKLTQLQRKQTRKTRGL
jgi:hypothetical protein